MIALTDMMYAAPTAAPAPPAGSGVVIALLRCNEGSFPDAPFRVPNVASSGLTFRSRSQGLESTGANYWFSGEGPFLDVALNTEGPNGSHCSIESEQRYNFVGALCLEGFCTERSTAYPCSLGGADDDFFCGVDVEEMGGNVWRFWMGVRDQGNEYEWTSASIDVGEGGALRQHWALMRDAAGFMHYAWNGMRVVSSDIPFARALNIKFAPFGSFDGGGSSYGMYRSKIGDLRCTDQSTVYSTFPFTPRTTRFPAP